MKKPERELLDSMFGTYKRTKFPFFSLMKLKREFGNDVVKELNILASNGYVRKREGANEALVELNIKKIADEFEYEG